MWMFLNLLNLLIDCMVFWVIINLSLAGKQTFRSYTGIKYPSKFVLYNGKFGICPQSILLFKIDSGHSLKHGGQTREILKPLKFLRGERIHATRKINEAVGCRS